MMPKILAKKMNCEILERQTTKEEPTYWTTESHPIRDVGEAHKADTAENINGDREVLGLERRMAHVLKNGWQEGAEAIQKDVLAKLNGTTIILVSIYPSYSGRATHLT